MGDLLNFEGCNFLRQRIVLSVLSGKPIKICEIRAKEQEPGLRDFEVTFIRLIESLSNGCKIDINETGTQLYFRPGLLHGGDIDLDCGNERGLSYFLEPLVYLSPFTKQPVHAVLKGVTNCPADVSVDVIKSAWLPVMRKFILNDDDLDIQIKKRGYQPEGGGLVVFTCPVCKQLRAAQLKSQGKVRRIRGTAFVSKVSPAMATRMIESAKSILTPILKDVFITVDHRKGGAGGNSPGFGMVLTAETTDGVVLTAESMSNPSGSGENPAIPEDVGIKAAHNLLDEVYRGGCVDSSGQTLALLFMALGPPDVSRLLLGPLSNYSVYTLRHISQFLGVRFKMDPIEAAETDETVGAEKLMLTCVGAGYTNINKVLL